MNTTTKEPKTYNAKGQPIPMSPASKAAGDAFISQLCRDIELDMVNPPLVKLANGKSITPAQVNAWNGREFGTGVACGLAIGAVVLAIVHMIF